MNRILVVYYSRTGHTDIVAGRLAARCHADIERIEESVSREGLVGYLRSAVAATLGLHPSIKRGPHRPGDYDLVIVGTPVWFWSVSSPVRNWLHRHHRALNNVAVFCTCGGSGHAKALDDLERLCGHAALAKLVLTEPAALRCEQNPAFQRFLFELKQVDSVSISRPANQEQAPA